ncbi:MAG: hypothetical protein WCJ49_02160 [Deltaproteobacteria bacterium]
MDKGLLAKKIVLLAVALVCLYATFSLFRMATDLSGKRLEKDFVSAFEERIKRVKPFLGNETSVGYFFAIDYETAKNRNFARPPGDAGSGEPAENSARGSLTTYAMRPLGVFLNLDRETDMMITDFTRFMKPVPQHIKLRHTDYTLVHDFEDGLSVYRRTR